MIEDLKIRLAEFIWNLPLQLGFSRNSRFQKLCLMLGDKIVFSEKCSEIKIRK